MPIAPVTAFGVGVDSAESGASISSDQGDSIGRRSGPDAVVRTARHSVVGFSGAVSNAIGGFALVFVMSRGLGPAATGAVSSLIVAVTMATKAGALGADTGLVRTIARQRALGRYGDVRQTLAWAVGPVAVLTVALAAIVFVFATDIAGWMIPDHPVGEATAMIRVAAVFLPVAAVSAALLGATRGFEAIWPYVGIEQMGKSLGRPLAVLAVILAGGSLVWVVAAWSVPALAGLLLVGWIVIRDLRSVEGHSPVTPRRQAVREFWQFSAPRAVSGLIELGMVSVGVVMVSALSSSAEAGVYFTVARLAMIGTLVLTAVRLTVAPQYSGLLSSGDIERAQRLHSTALSWVVAASFPFFAAMIAFPDLALGVFGDEFQTGAVALVVLSVAMLIDAGTGNSETVLLMSGRSRWNLINATTAFLINLGLGWLLIPSLGATGAALAATGGILAAKTLTVYQVHRFIGITSATRAHVVAGIGAAVCLGAAALAADVLGLDSTKEQVLLCAGGLVAYAAVAAIFRRDLHLDHFIDGVRGGSDASTRATDSQPESRYIHPLVAAAYEEKGSHDQR